MTDNIFAALLDGVPRYGVNVVSAKMERHPYGVYVELDRVLAALAAAVPADLAEAGKVLEGVTLGRVVQFHPSFCKEAEGAPFSEWDSSHDLSVIQPDGKRYRIGSMRHANDAAFFQWCREGVPALLARIAAQEAQIKGLDQKVNGLCDLYSQASEQVQSAGAALAAERAKVTKLVEAGKALGLREIVAGWNGEGKEKPYTPHPAHLWATIKTTCGAVYALDAAITEANHGT